MASADFTATHPATPAETHTRDLQARYELVTDLVLDLVVQFSPDWVLTYCSPAAYGLLGAAPEVLLGYSLYALIHPDDAGLLDEAHDSLRTIQAPLVLRLRWLRADGGEFYAETTLRAIYADGSLAGIVAFARDLRPHLALEQFVEHELELATERERIAFLTAFIRHVSHDFRTPLAIINSSMFFLRRELDEEQRAARATVVEAQVQRLNGFIEEINTIVHLNVPAWYHLVEVNVQQLASKTLLELDEPQRSRLHLAMPGVLPPISGDFTLLKFALLHLLQNALHHTDADTQITLSAVNHGAVVTLMVHDTGEGIAPEHLPHIFAYFFRGDQNRSTKTGMVGLGLPIVRKIIETHGGSVEVESTLEAGTTVALTLPIWRH
ncbi:MAG: HAMP domain-containing histidine kinase [Armatimonadetes bacterium]|nr:HAMP domain-containing histidine kinase [Anaerolineae bacterium]